MPDIPTFELLNRDAEASVRRSILPSMPGSTFYVAGSTEYGYGSARQSLDDAMRDVDEALRNSTPSPGASIVIWSVTDGHSYVVRHWTPVSNQWVLASESTA